MKVTVVSKEGKTMYLGTLVEVKNRKGSHEGKVFAMGHSLWVPVERIIPFRKD